MIKTFIVADENYEIYKLHSSIQTFLNINEVPYIKLEYVYHHKRLFKYARDLIEDKKLHVILCDNPILLDYVDHKDCYVIDKNYSIKSLLEYDLVVNMLNEGLNLSGLYLAGYFQ
jgi:hypothetical protein